MHVLILGGTTEAGQLAAELTARPGLRVTTSLAGRVARPRLPAGEVRIGGFGGVEAMTDWLSGQRVDAVVDATHPFAAAISANAARAARAAGVPLTVLRRPGWQAVPGDRWHSVATLAEAAALLPSLGRRVFLTTGRLGLAAFADLGQLHFLVRSVEPPVRRCRPTPRCSSTGARTPSTARRPCCARTPSTSSSPRTVGDGRPPPSSPLPVHWACRWSWCGGHRRPGT